MAEENRYCNEGETAGFGARRGVAALRGSLELPIGGEESGFSDEHQ